MIILLLPSSCKHISLPGLIAIDPFFPHSYSHRPISVLSGLLPPSLLTPFCTGGPASSFQSAGASPEHSCHSPIPFSIKSKILNCGLRDSPSGEGKSFFRQLLSLPICFGTHFWRRRINQFAFEQCTSQTWALDTI